MPERERNHIGITQSSNEHIRGAEKSVIDEIADAYLKDYLAGKTPNEDMLGEQLVKEIERQQIITPSR